MESHAQGFLNPKMVRSVGHGVPRLTQVVVSGSGNNFSAGIDLAYLKDMFDKLGQESCPGRMREKFRRHILTMQVSITWRWRCVL